MAFQFLGYLLVAIVANYVVAALAPRVEPPKAATLDDFDAPTAEDGRPIPWVFGTVWIRGPNVLWYGDMRAVAIRKKQGKK